MKFKMALVVLIFLLLLPWKNNYRAFANSPAEPKLIVAETKYEFGEVHEGEKVRHHFVMKNKGGSPLKIIDVKTD